MLTEPPPIARLVAPKVSWCKHCGTKEAVAHILLVCLKYNELRVELIEAVNRQGIDRYQVTGLTKKPKYKDIISGILSPHGRNYLTLVAWKQPNSVLRFGGQNLRRETCQ